MSNWTKSRPLLVPAVLGALGCCWLTTSTPATAYPPAVGIVGKSRQCVSCHSNDGPWKDDDNLIVDLLDKESGVSLRQEDGSFAISAKVDEKTTVLVVLGRVKGDTAPAPHRNGWIFIDPSLIARDSLGAKFAPGWEANLSMSCRLVGDTHADYEGANITVTSMTVRPTGEAKDTDIEWQFMLTSGDAVKGNAQAGLTQNCFTRTIRLKVDE